MPKLQKHVSLLFMDGVSDLSPTRHLGFRIDPWSSLICAGCRSNFCRLGNDEAARRSALRIIFCIKSPGMSPGWSLRRRVSGAITTLCRSVIVPRMNGLNSFRVAVSLIAFLDHSRAFPIYHLRLEAMGGSSFPH
jgi:hypothetical protein